MTTIEVPVASVTTLRKGDVITHIDGRAVGPFTVAGPASTRVIPLERGNRTIDMNIYPDTNIRDQVTIERTEAKRRTTRTIGGVKFINTGEQYWETEDGRFHVSYQEAGVTECEHNHPVKLTREMVQAAQENRNTGWAQPILSAHRQGLRGYVCEAGTEHFYFAWSVWNVKADEYAFDIRDAQTFTEAAQQLASHLTK